VNVPVNVVGPVEVTLSTVPLPTQPVVAGMTIVGPPPRVSLAVTLTVTTSPGTTATGLGTTVSTGGVRSTVNVVLPLAVLPAISDTVALTGATQSELPLGTAYAAV